MAIVVTMPRLSDTMTEGTVATWLKKVGDKIKEGDILAEIETDKATMEFESFNSGVLLHIGIEAGQTAPVDSLLAIIGQEGEDISTLLNGGVSEKEERVAETNVEASTTNSISSFEIPAGVKVVTMPRLSDTMTTGTVASWLKNIGDTIKEGDILAEIETDKATMEFESFNSGTLLYIGVQTGDSAPVDSILAILGPAGTDVSTVLANFSTGGTVEIPKTEIIAESKEEVVSAPQKEASNNTGRIFASPLAKKIAQEKGINLASVKGTGENGRITKADVEGYSPSVAQVNVSRTTTDVVVEAMATVAEVKPFVPAGEVYQEEVKNSQMRKVIAKRLSESKFTAPHYYLTIELDMDNAMTSRSMINNLPNTKVSFNDMVIKASAMALKKHPQVNSQWKEEAMILNHHVNIGVAVAVEDGLVVPVLKFADQMTLSQIGTSVKDMAGRAKIKKIQPNEMEGSTFTISNLGMFGIQSFTSIINQPNSAILSVGAIVEKPVVKNGQIMIGNTMTVTLACDHRTVDGATGAQFLQTFKAYMENPVTMLA
ncbi:pyruvate dehydrogenase complex dihydrolipoamide acetyltransferase [Flavobacterium columnare]|uniref:Dihydrolipoamide acetyltransferase component of pyruvate dehydrogenase complex n=1 Tax=Flavobacterium columnare TaxID=996 RepID=A0AAI8CJM9_9FLAO|nr:pyruvate dehydrogenase complex dihydrolipoamide acetyltransferase [Flavobacterium columnare]AMO21255.1 pyruvate dehydrogenase [Flavobacterium columnare]AUX19274.1 pyruvate dehydrogenase [Flavobacterium columnare]MEB3799540.1 2-oxo acid dehydrogenase subunit E2 [Flavobacterium columnare]QOG58356.1 2-oxo acid dehydrogenase subunit E2 [Flavobacterium columnare]QOG61079.1 2-oxo acid dehydrogenase subunit E2 [Flavobacterium columnare]